MKRLSLFITLLVVASLACNASQSQPPQSVPTTDSVSTSAPAPTIDSALQTVPTVQADCAETLCLTDSFSLVELQNRSLDENVLKLFSAAVDEKNNRVYVAGILTLDIAVLDGATETWIGTVKTGLEERSIKYIYFDSTVQYLYIYDAGRKELRRVDVTSGEIVGPVSLAEGAFGQPALVDEVRTRLYLTTAKGLTAFDGRTLEELYTVNGIGKRVGPLVYDSAKDVIYLLGSANQEDNQSIFVLSPENGQVTGTIQYAAQQAGRARWMFFDSAAQSFIVGFDRSIHLFDVNGNETGSFLLASERTVEDMLYDPATKQVFVRSITPPHDGQVAAIGAHMDVYDLSGNLKSSFDFGRKPYHMSLNSANGHLYIPNGDAAVIWSIDTRAPSQAVSIHLGDSVEQIVPSGDGSVLYLASRLGGSYIGKYNQDSGAFESFTSGTWPLPLRRDASGEHLFALNIWDSALSVYSINPNQTLLGTIPLGIPAGSTDRLPDLAIDSTHKLAYAAYPEFATVAVVNWETMQPVATISIEGLKTGDTGGGPGQLQVAINEAENRVFIYDGASYQILIFDAANQFAPLGRVNLRDASDSLDTAGADLFFFDALANRLYLGGLELDAVTGQPTGRTLSAGDKIFGMDSASNTYWAFDSATSAILAIDRETLSARFSQPLPEPASYLPNFAYNPARNQIHVGYLTSANVYTITIK